MLPMFRLHISGAKAMGAARRCRRFITADPPVVMLTTAWGLSADRKDQCAGSEDGRPSSGWRACRCRIAAPASAAAMAWAAMASGVTGRCGDCEGTWIEPVTAQVIKILVMGEECHARGRQGQRKARDPAERLRRTPFVSPLARGPRQPARVWLRRGYWGKEERGAQVSAACRARWRSCMASRSWPRPISSTRTKSVKLWFRLPKITSAKGGAGRSARMWPRDCRA